MIRLIEWTCNQPYTNVVYKYNHIWRYLNVYIIGDKQWVWCVDWDEVSINPVTALTTPIRLTPKVYTRIALFTFATRVHFSYPQWNGRINEHMTMPNICIYICEQKHVHKRSQRNMRLNLVTVDIFRIFTVLGMGPTLKIIKIYTCANCE